MFGNKFCSLVDLERLLPSRHKSGKSFVRLKLSVPFRVHQLVEPPSV